MTPRLRLLGLAYARSFFLVHGGAVLVLGIAIAAESADEDLRALAGRLSVNLPHTWALLAPPLCLAAAALAVSRLRTTGQLTALGSVGVAVRSVLGGAFLVGLFFGLGCAVTGVASSPAVEVSRVTGGWWLRGTFVPDDVGNFPVPAGPVLGRWLSTAWLCPLAAWTGASLGAWRDAGRVLVVAAAVLCLDLVQRGLPLGHAPFVGGLAAALAVSMQWANRAGRRWPT